MSEVNIRAFGSITKAIPFLLILMSCGVQTATERTRFDLDDAILNVRSKCVDTLRVLSGETRSIPSKALYRDVAYVFQVQPEIDLQVTQQLGDSSFAVVALSPDDSLSVYVLRWRDAIEISPVAATFSFLVKTSIKGTAYLKVADAREKRFNRGVIRTAGKPVEF